MARTKRLVETCEELDGPDWTWQSVVVAGATVRVYGYEPHCKPIGTQKPKLEMALRSKPKAT